MHLDTTPAFEETSRTVEEAHARLQRMLRHDHGNRLQMHFTGNSVHIMTVRMGDQMGVEFLTKDVRYVCKRAEYNGVRLTLTWDGYSCTWVEFLDALRISLPCIYVIPKKYIS